MIFKHYFDKRPVIYSNPGEMEEPMYEYKYNKDGTKELVRSKEVKRTFDEIQANKDYCNIAELVKRFALGDENALNRVQGFYADMSDMPKTYAEMIERVDNCRSSFEALDPEIKAKFDNNPDVFWSNYGTAEFAEKIGSYYEKVFSDVESEVKDNE